MFMVKPGKHLVKVMVALAGYEVNVQVVSKEPPTIMVTEKVLYENRTRSVCALVGAESAVASVMTDGGLTMHDKVSTYSA